MTSPEVFYDGGGLVQPPPASPRDDSLAALPDASALPAAACSATGVDLEGHRVNAPSEEILAIFSRAFPTTRLAPTLYSTSPPEPVRQWHPAILLPSAMRALQHAVPPHAVPELSQRPRSGRRRWVGEVAAATASAAHAAAGGLLLAHVHPGAAAAAQLEPAAWVRRPIGTAAPAA